jgi:glutathione peroxidase
MMLSRIKRYIYLAGNSGRIHPMHRLFFALLFCVCLLGAASVYDFSLDSIDGKPAPLADYKGKVLLLVNVASKCGFTPQYTQLEAVYEKYKGQGLVVIGFPANNFMAQEPGTNEEIKEFCSRKYNVSFPMYSKISVKGDDKAPLYQYLTSTGGGEIKWNFTKFLVGRDGNVIARYESKVKPDEPEVVAAIEKALH